MDPTRPEARLAEARLAEAPEGLPEVSPAGFPSGRFAAVPSEADELHAWAAFFRERAGVLPLEWDGTRDTLCRLATRFDDAGASLDRERPPRSGRAAPLAQTHSGAEVVELHPAASTPEQPARRSPARP